MSIACDVCYESYTPRNPARLLRRCGHDLCESCIRALLSTQAGLAACPTCRTHLLPPELSRDYVRILLHSEALAAERRISLGSKNSIYTTLATDLVTELFPVCRALSALKERVEWDEAGILQQLSTEDLLSELHRRELLSFSPEMPNSHGGTATERYQTTVFPKLKNTLRPRWRGGIGNQPGASPSRKPEFESSEPVLSAVSVGWWLTWLVLRALRLVANTLLVMPWQLWRSLPLEQRGQIWIRVPLVVGAVWYAMRVFRSRTNEAETP